MKMRFDCDDDGILIRVSRKKKKKQIVKPQGRAQKTTKTGKPKRKFYLQQKKSTKKKPPKPKISLWNRKQNRYTVLNQTQNRIKFVNDEKRTVIPF